ncbi:hypothetical protein D3C84_1295520 [compost metagenome]
MKDRHQEVDLEDRIEDSNVGQGRITDILQSNNVLNRLTDYGSRRIRNLTDP